MSKISKVLRDAENGSLIFLCPGCNTRHRVYVDYHDGAVNWGWNRNVDSPTFTPSILTRWTKTLISDKEMRELLDKPGPHEIPHKDIVCHMFITEEKYNT